MWRKMPPSPPWLREPMPGPLHILLFNSIGLQCIYWCTDLCSEIGIALHELL